MIVRLCEWDGKKEDCKLHIGKEVTLDHVPEQGGFNRTCKQQCLQG